jgi:quercetin dioxygenase-like cupin family protein
MAVVNVAEKVSFRPDKMAKVSLFNEPQMFVDVYCLEPGQQQAAHAHAGAAKVYYVLEGEGVFLVGAEERKLGPGHAIMAPSGEPHGVRNEGPGRLTCLVAMAPNPNFE